MIPKILHYCWFGSKELPKLEQQCIDTWKKILPDYQIMFWNEDNFNLNSCTYVRQAYERKKYAFVSDYARVFILQKYGGIYLDTDVEVLKSFDPFLKHDSFLGFENRTYVGTAVIATCAQSDFTKRMLDYYQSTEFIDSKGNENLTTNVTLLDRILTSMGMEKNNTRQSVQGIEIYPRDYFFPKKISNTEFKVTDVTVCIHKMNATWLTARQKRRGSNTFWINICRPMLRFLLKCCIIICGQDRARTIELKVRNLLK